MMGRELRAALGAAALTAAAAGTAPALAASVIERASLAAGGVQANGDSLFPSVSADGRFVAFDSDATNLAPGDRNGRQDVFVRDRRARTTELVSISTGGAQGNGFSNLPSISGDGRFVAFASAASNLVAGDANGQSDVFVRDRERGTTELVSVSTGGAQGNDYSQGPEVSADGRYVAFESGASNLVPRDTNGQPDVFVRDRLTGRTILVSVQPGGGQFAANSLPTTISASGLHVGFDTSFPDGRNEAFVRDLRAGRTMRLSVGLGGARANGGAFVGGISADGRFAALTSTATNLVPGDTNGEQDVFVRDLRTGATTLVSTGVGGAPADAGSGGGLASISTDGRYVAFDSDATNLVAGGDTNDALDVFIHDRRTGRTSSASVTAAGVRGNSGSENPAISANGRFVVFDSFATNLTRAPDTNNAFDVFIATTR